MYLLCPSGFVLDGSILTVNVWVENVCVIGTVQLIELHWHLVYVHEGNGPEWLMEVLTVSTVSVPSEDLWTVIPNHLDQSDDKKSPPHYQRGHGGVEQGYPPLKPLVLLVSRRSLAAI